MVAKPAIEGVISGSIWVGFLLVSGLLVRSLQLVVLVGLSVWAVACVIDVVLVVSGGSCAYARHLPSGLGYLSQPMSYIG